MRKAFVFILILSFCFVDTFAGTKKEAENLKSSSKDIGKVFGQKIKKHSKMFLNELEKNGVKRKRILDIQDFMKLKLHHKLSSLFVELSKLGEEGVAAGKEVEKVAASNDFPLSCRVDAVKTIGYIGYKKAENTLLKLLGNKYYWPIVYVAVESLGKIRSKKAVGKLKEVSKNYWFKAVRIQAEKAIKRISEKGGGDRKEKIDDFFAANFGRHDLPETNKTVFKTEKKCREFNNIVKDKSSTTQEELDATGYFVRERSRTWSNNDGVTVDGGYLMGTNQGEFIGELVFYDKKTKKHKQVIRANVNGLVKSPEFGIILARGLNNWGLNFGRLVKIKKKDGKWIYENWFELPGDPHSLKLIKGGIVVETKEGSVLIYGDDEIVQCK